MSHIYFVLCGLFPAGFLAAQHCDFVDMLRVPEQWTGSLSDFDMNPQTFQLLAAEEGESAIEFLPETESSDFYIDFSLDFPPSLSNRLELELIFSGSEDEILRVVLSVGETGDADGLLLGIGNHDSLWYERKHWTGKYARGADRSKWMISVKKNRFLLSDPESGREIDVALPPDVGHAFHLQRLRLRCLYTKTRSDRFYFHRMQLWPEGFPEVPKLSSGEVFLTEVFPGAASMPPFIEIFSDLSQPVCAPGWAFSVNDRLVDLPPVSVAAGEYIAFVFGESTNSGPSLVTVPGVAELLPPAKEWKKVKLYFRGELIHEMTVPEEEIEDGFSWEMTDVLSPCRTDNWGRSEIAGGSPGTENSVFETLGPPGVKFRWQHPGSGKLIFPYIFADEEELLRLIRADRVIEIRQEGAEVFINFEETENLSGPLDIIVRGEVNICADVGEGWDTVLSVRSPVWAEEYDLLITEVMYDPARDCPEYIELTSMRDYPLWLEDPEVRVSDRLPQPIGLPVPVMPGTSWPVTRDRETFQDCYPEAEPERIIAAELPQLPNRGASLEISHHAGTLDAVFYEPAQQHSGFKEDKGIALERNYLQQARQIWRSGYPQHGYRSPGFLPEWQDMTGDELLFSSKGIRIGRDGEDERLIIEWAGSDRLRSGYLTIEIFDVTGAKTDRLLNSQPVRGGEMFYWDGRNESGQLLKEGLYLFRGYYFDEGGQKKVYKRTCVLSHQ